MICPFGRFLLTVVSIGLVQYNCFAADQRLPHDVDPRFYNITLEPIFQNFTFKGNVDILIRVNNHLSQIRLHAAQLKILNVRIFDKNKHAVTVDKTHYIEKNDEVFLINPHPFLIPGLFHLQIDYTGFLNTTDHMGFFRSGYTVNDKMEWLAATVFSPTYARRAFPCFDEPSYKAQFQVNIVREPGYTALSSMLLKGTLRHNGKFVDTFVTTPNISTYQLAFIIFKTSHFSNGTNGKVRVFARRGDIKEDRARFALEMSSEILSELSNFSVQKFLYKMDLVAIPGFPFKSCESFGLLMFAENNLMSNWQYETAKKEQQIWLHIAHEMILQWFGSYVTPSWWNFLWMMEGITTFLDYQVGQKLKPLWRMDEQCWLQVMQPSLELDADVESKPMTRHIMVDKHAIADMFDPITYDKAASVLRMLQHVMTPKLFEKGLFQYLRNKQLAVAEPDDLWNAMQEVLEGKIEAAAIGSVDMLTFMKDWTLQPHYPVITVIRDYDKGVINLTQEPIRDWTGSEIYEGTWHVPINSASKKDPNFTNTQPQLWLSDKLPLSESANCTTDDWLILNKQATGFYRVNYDHRNWISISNYLNTSDFEKIHVLNRAQLIDDAFHLAKAGHINYSTALNLTNYLHRETDYIVIKVFLRNLGYFNKMACWSSLYELFEARVATILEASLVKLGFKAMNHGKYRNRDKHHIDNLHRITVISWACKMGNKFCRDGAISELENYRKMDANLKFQIFCGALRGANETIWNMVDDLLAKSNPNVLSALGCSENGTLLLKFIEREMVKDNIKVFQYIYEKGNFGKKFVFHYFVTHFDEIYKTFGVDIAQIPLGLSPLLGTENHLFLMEDLKRKAKEYELMESFDVAIRNIKFNLHLANKFLPDITTWFRNNL